MEPLVSSENPQPFTGRKGGSMVQFNSVAQSYLTLCDPMDCSTPGSPVRYQLLELAQTHVHWVANAIQPSHPLSSFSSCRQSFPVSGPFQWKGNMARCLFPPSDSGLCFSQPGHQKVARFILMVTACDYQLYISREGVLLAWLGPVTNQLRPGS